MSVASAMSASTFGLDQVLRIVNTVNDQTIYNLIVRSIEEKNRRSANSSVAGSDWTPEESDNGIVEPSESASPVDQAAAVPQGDLDYDALLEEVERRAAVRASERKSKAARSKVDFDEWDNPPSQREPHSRAEPETIIRLDNDDNQSERSSVAARASRNYHASDAGSDDGYRRRPSKRGKQSKKYDSDSSSGKKRYRDRDNESEVEEAGSDGEYYPKSRGHTHGRSYEARDRSPSVVRERTPRETRDEERTVIEKKPESEFDHSEAPRSHRRRKSVIAIDNERPWREDDPSEVTGRDREPVPYPVDVFNKSLPPSNSTGTHQESAPFSQPSQANNGSMEWQQLSNQISSLLQAIEDLPGSRGNASRREPHYWEGETRQQAPYVN